MILEIDTLIENQKSLNILILLLQDPKRKLSRKKIDFAFAKSLVHNNKINIKIIRLLSLIAHPPAKTETEKMMDNIKKEGMEDCFDDIFGSMFGGMENK